VILATGFAEMPESARGYARLSKPFTQAEMAEQLKTVQPLPAKSRVLKFPAAGPKA
jgi:hypothetical protein